MKLKSYSVRTYRGKYVLFVSVFSITKKRLAFTRFWGIAYHCLLSIFLPHTCGGGYIYINLCSKLFESVQYERRLPHIRTPKRLYRSAPSACTYREDYVILSCNKPYGTNKLSPPPPPPKLRTRKMTLALDELLISHIKLSQSNQSRFLLPTRMFTSFVRSLQHLHNLGLFLSSHLWSVIMSLRSTVPCLSACPGRHPVLTVFWLSSAHLGNSWPRTLSIFPFVSVSYRRRFFFHSTSGSFSLVPL